MAKKEEYNLEEEVERLSRQSKINMNKSEYSFNKRLKRLDEDIEKIMDDKVKLFDEIMDDKVKLFDENKKLTEDYLTMENDTSTIDRYREKLRKI